MWTANSLRYKVNLFPFPKLSVIKKPLYVYFLSALLFISSYAQRYSSPDNGIFCNLNKIKNDGGADLFWIWMLEHINTQNNRSEKAFFFTWLEICSVEEEKVQKLNIMLHPNNRFSFGVWFFYLDCQWDWIRVVWRTYFFGIMISSSWSCKEDSKKTGNPVITNITFTFTPLPWKEMAPWVAVWSSSGPESLHYASFPPAVVSQSLSFHLYHF